MKRRRERFGENGFFVGNVIGNGMKISHGEPEEISESAIAVLDAKNGALKAVGREAAGAHLAFAADAIDFTDDALADPLGIDAVGGGSDGADELMAESAGEFHVAFCDFKIGLANAGSERFDEDFAGFGDGISMVAVEFDRGSVEGQSAHGLPSAGGLSGGLIDLFIPA